jgi:predicted enzyme related to lactoylglutathione lyase
VKNFIILAAACACATLGGCGDEPQERAETSSANGAAAVEAATKREARMARLNYVEMPATDIGKARSFYEQAFGWKMTEFAPTYAATVTGDTDIGLDADLKDAPKAPLPVIEVDDLEAALKAVEDAGGTVSRPIFAFPGGRRFHATDPSGNEIAVSKVG